MMQIKRYYETACKAADDARMSAEKAEKDLHITKGQVEKVRALMR